MTRPFHFDRAALEAAIDRSHAAIAAEIRRVKADRPPALVEAEVAALAVHRAFTLWLVGCKEAGIGHELVADTAGCMLGELVAMVSENYRCSCVRSRIADGIGRQLAGRDTGEAVRVSGADITFPVTMGGNA